MLMPSLVGTLTQIALAVIAGLALVHMEGRPYVPYADSLEKGKKKASSTGGHQPRRSSQELAKDFTTLLLDFELKADEIISQIKESGQKDAQEIIRQTSSETEKARSDFRQQYQKEKMQLMQELRYEIAWFTLMIEDGLQDAALDKEADTPKPVAQSQTQTGSHA